MDKLATAINVTDKVMALNSSEWSRLIEICLILLLGLIGYVMYNKSQKATNTLIKELKKQKAEDKKEFEKKEKSCSDKIEALGEELHACLDKLLSIYSGEIKK